MYTKGHPRRHGVLFKGKKMFMTDSDTERFCCVDEKVYNSDFIHYDQVPCVNCHEKLEGRVPLVDLSKNFFFSFTFCYWSSLMSLCNDNFSAKLMNIHGWVCVSTLHQSIDFVCCLRFGSKSHLFCVLAPLSQIE